QPLGRFWTIIVVPAVEMRVKTNCFNLRLSESYLFGCGLSTASDNPNPGNSVRVHDCPFQGAPTAHRAANHGVESLDSQQISKLSFVMHGVPKSQNRKAGSIGSLVFIQCRGTCRPIAATNHIGGNYKPLSSVDGFTWANQVFPPTGLW